MKNVKMLTKESSVQLKNKWFLFVFYLLFLILSFGIIMGLAHFTFSFENNANDFVTFSGSSTVEIKNQRLSVDDLIKNDDKNTYYNFLKNQKNDGNFLNSEQINNIVENLGYVPKQLKDLYTESTPYFHNLYGEWVYEKAFNLAPNHDSHSENPQNHWINPQYSNNYNLLDFRQPTLKGDYKNEQIRMYGFAIQKNDKNKNDLLFPWQYLDDKEKRFKLVKSISSFSLNKFNEQDNKKDIIVTPTFLKYHHLKLGDLVNFSYGNQTFTNLRIVATGLYSEFTLSDVSDLVFLNPFIFNQIYLNSNQNFTVDFNIYSPNEPKNYDDFYSSQAAAVRNTLLKSIDGSKINIDDFVPAKTVKSSPLGSLDIQFVMYNLFTWIVTIVLAILLMISYQFIQALNINANKKIMINLKAMGFNKYELAYYLTISFLPILILGAGLGILLGYFVYQLLTSTLGHSIGFVLQSSPNTDVGYIVFAVLFIVLIALGILISYKNVKGKTLSINNKNGISFFKLWLLSFNKISFFNNDGFSKIVYAFQITNLWKAVSTLIIGILSLTLISISLQFTSSINSALNYKAPIFSSIGNSISYKEYDQGKIVNSDLVLNKDVKSLIKLNIKNDSSVIDDVNKWINDVKKQISGEPIYDFYFDQVGYFSEVYSKYKDAINDVLVQNHLASLEKSFSTINDYLGVYEENFGINSLPRIMFKNRVKDDDFVNYSEVHNANIYDNGEFENKTSIQTYDDTTNKLGNDEIIINNNTASQFKLKVGDYVNLKFDTTNSWSEQPFKLKVIKIDNKMFGSCLAIVNFNKLRNDLKIDDNQYDNAVISKSEIPYDIRNIVLENQNGKGDRIEDYISSLSNLEQGIRNVGYTSLPIEKTLIENKTVAFKQFTELITIFLVLVSACILFIISILISFENKKNVMILKTLGYKRTQTLFIFTTIYFFTIIIAFIAAIFIAGTLIDSFSSTLISKIGIDMMHNYSAITIIPPLVIGLFFYGSIAFAIAKEYICSKVQDVTFAE